jgi:Zn-dependent peptidase ImmA (M78 family)/DNA-binding XRE family transcriptional regulator
MLTPSRLAVARKRQGLTLTQLAGLTRISTHSLSVFENGHQAPAPGTLTRLARALDVDAAFLSGDDIDEIPVGAVSFRALSKMTARQRDRALADGRIALLINDWIEARFRLPPPEIPTLTGHDPETAAEIVRARWGLGERPVRNMLHVIEAQGVRIYSLTELNEALDAYSLYWDGKPFVFLSTGKTGERGRFDAAHELGHLVLHGEHQVAGERPTAEAEANRFAAAFLMPRASVLAAGLVNAPVDRILAAKSQWDVAAMALTHRLHELELLTDWGYRAACVALGRLGYKRAEPAGIPRETSQLLGKVLAQLRAEGMTPARIAAALGISVTELRSHVFGLTLTAVSLRHDQLQPAVTGRPSGSGRPPADQRPGHQDEAARAAPDVERADRGPGGHGA